MALSVEIMDFARLFENAVEVEVYLDKEGLEDLLKQLSFLKKEGDHLHFMSPAWGGHELTDKPFGEGNVGMPHPGITYLGDSAP